MSRVVAIEAPWTPATKMESSPSLAVSITSTVRLCQLLLEKLQTNVKISVYYHVHMLEDMKEALTFTND